MEFEFYFTEHALIEMDNDELEIEDIKRIAAEGVVIEDYPTDRPFPSKLKLGRSENGWIHVVCSTAPNNVIHIITTYTPDSTKWDSTFTNRIKK